MGKEDVLKNMLDLSALAKDLDELNELKRTVDDLKQQKAQLQNSINLLKKQQLEERENFPKVKAECDKEISELNSKIANLKAVRDSLSSQAVPELKKLEAEKETNRMALAELSVKSTKLDNDATAFSRRQAEFNLKVDILKQITELAKGL